MLNVDKMSRRTSVRLGDLEEPALLVAADRDHVQANDSAITLMGEGWQACATALVLQTMAQADGWHHRVFACPSMGRARQFAVHSTPTFDGCQLILLDEAESSDLTPSPLLEEILESISDCFFALDAQGMFVYANSNAADFFDTNREDLLGQNLLSMHPFDSRFSEAYNKAMIENVSVTYDSRSPDQARWIEVRGYPVDGGMACYFTDITDRVTSQERITFMALHDSLTRLPNRRYLQEELIRAVARGKRGTVSALLFMDMDRFKMVNDTVGHAAGDAVLLEFAGVVASCVREEDMFARFGGDEFALLLGGANAEDGMIIGDRIKQAVVEHEFRVGSHSFSLGVSVGMTLVDGTLDEGHVMALADDAMYEAKTSGGEGTHYRAPDAKPDPVPEG